MKESEGFDLRPLVVNNIYGLRSFRPTDDGTLVPMSMGAKHTGFVWNEGINEAWCSSDLHIPAVQGCYCGFYAYTDGNNTIHKNYASVQGIIEAWGRLVLGTRGFRAEKAKIMVLVEPDITTLVNDTVVVRFNKFKRKHPDIPVVPDVSVALMEFPVSQIHPRDFK